VVPEISICAGVVAVCLIWHGTAYVRNKCSRARRAIVYARSRATRPCLLFRSAEARGRGAKIDNPSGLMTARLASALALPPFRGGLALARACKIKRRLSTGTTANAGAIAVAATMNDLPWK